MHIDAHCHIYPDEYFEILEKEGPRYGVKLLTNADGERIVDIKGMMHPPIEPFTNVDLRLKTMDEMNLDMNILSFSSNPAATGRTTGWPMNSARRRTTPTPPSSKNTPRNFMDWRRSPHRTSISRSKNSSARWANSGSRAGS